MNMRTISNALYHTLLAVNIALWIILVISPFLGTDSLEPIGKELGPWALYILWIVTLPGILKRFGAKGFLQRVQIVLMRSRRRLGVLAFTLGLIHSAWQRLFYYVQDGLPPLEAIPVFEIMGATAFLLLIPLFLTSNDTALRKLKSAWGKIHALIYLALWFIGLHLWFQGSYLNASLTFAIAALQIVSWIYFHSNKKTNPRKRIGSIEVSVGKK